MFRTTERKLLLTVGLGLTGYIAYTLYHASRDEEMVEHLDGILDLHESHQGLAEDCIIDDPSLATSPVIRRHGEPPTEPDDAVVENPRARDVGGMFQVDRSRSTLRDYRMVHPDMEKIYVNHVLCEVRLRFGRVSDTDANRRCIRRYADQIMTAHRVRPTHRWSVMPLLLELAFLDDSTTIRSRRDARNYRRWCDSFLRYWFYGRTRGGT